MARQGRPTVAQGRTRKYGEIGENRAAWVETVPATFTMYLPQDSSQNEEKVGNKEPGMSVAVYITRGPDRPMMIDFTRMTHAELTLVRALLNKAMDLAEPITKERDEVAQNAFEAGDDTYARVYRAVPRLIVREGPFEQNGLSVWNGHEDAPSGE